MRRWLPMLALLSALAPATAPASTPAASDRLPVFAHPATAAQLAQLLAPVAQPLKGAVGLQGHFAQLNHLHDLPQPLQSSGNFLVARGLGVDWHTRQPFDAEVVLTAKALIQRSGGDVQVLGADQQPGLAAVSRTFDALFTLDLPQLSQRFKLYGVQDQQGWVLGLKPRDAALADHLAAVVVRGHDRPAEVTLYQADGDHTEIRFSDVDVLQALTAAQRKSFAP